jgi:hypothetical protein
MAVDSARFKCVIINTPTKLNNATSVNCIRPNERPDQDILRLNQPGNINLVVSIMFQQTSGPGDPVLLQASANLSR